MSLGNQVPAESGAYAAAMLRANWGEQIVIAVATSLGVLIVALTAVLMGIA
jgi:ABC-type branched-subunit amino acid transport system permease subunit